MTPEVLNPSPIDIIEDHISGLPQTEFRVEHYFSDGLYVRELHIPKDQVITGKIHKRGHINFLMKGEILVNDGTESYHLKAPMIIKSEPGTRRAGITISDCIWATSHATEATTVAEAEDELTEPIRASIKKKLENINVIHS